MLKSQKISLRMSEIRESLNSPADEWRVFECYKARCHAPQREALS